MSVRSVVAVLLVLGMGAWSGVHGAQRPATGKARISGIVLNSTTKLPVPRARVVLSETGDEILTDSTGRFLFKDLAAGNYVVQVFTETIKSVPVPVTLGARDRFEVEFAVAPPGTAVLGAILPELEVRERTPIRLTHRPDFDRRRTDGQGRYIDRAYIDKHNPFSVPDLLRSVPGIRMECRANSNVCTVYMARSPRGCSPSYWIDGIPATDPSVIYLTNPKDLAGIEIYSGQSEIPPELNGQRAFCGVIALWTRVGERPSEQPPDPPAKPEDHRS